jgi:hypothetical protein
MHSGLHRRQFAVKRRFNGPMGQTNVNVPGDGSSGSGTGMIVGLLIAVVIIGFVVWYFLLSGNGGGGTPTDSGGAAPSALRSLLRI